MKQFRKVKLKAKSKTVLWKSDESYMCDKFETEGSRDVKVEEHRWISRGTKVWNEGGTACNRCVVCDSRMNTMSLSMVVMDAGGMTMMGAGKVNGSDGSE